MSESTQEPNLSEQVQVPLVIDDNVELEEVLSEEESKHHPTFGIGQVTLSTESEPANEDDAVEIPVVQVEDDVIQTPPFRQISSSQDEYEYVSSKRTSLTPSEERDKTPTPPEIQIPTSAYDNPIPPQAPSSPVTIEVPEPEASAEGGPVLPHTPSLWERITSLLTAVTDWIRWLFGQK
uniref:Adhesin n=1 Tax=Panagrellus redivivus TaxID=6233 RepID=A0A7E4VSM3_PANRE